MAVIRDIRINKGQLAERFKIEVSRADGKGMGGLASAAIERVSNQLVSGPVKNAVESAAINRMTEGLQLVNASLKSGITFDTGHKSGWEPLSPMWIAKKKSGYKDKFWRNEGNLAKGFHIFSKAYAAKLNSSKTVVTLRTRSATYGKKFFKYELKIALPEHPEGFINAITHGSFVTGSAYTGLGYADPGSPSFVKIAFMEGEGSSKRYRPFIAKVMAAKGRIYHDEVNAIINRAVYHDTDNINKARHRLVL